MYFANENDLTGVTFESDNKKLISCLSSEDMTPEWRSSEGNGCTRGGG